MSQRRANVMHQAGMDRAGAAGRRDARAPRAGAPRTRITLEMVGLLSLGLAAGCAELPPQVLRQLDQARAALQVKDYAACERITSPIIVHHARNPGVAEALYLRGQGRLLTEQRRPAWEDFDRGRILAREPALRAVIQAQLGNMAFDDGAYEQAVLFYEPAVPVLADRPPKDRLLYQYAAALQRSGRFAEARPWLERIGAQYPASSWADPARRLAQWPYEYFSVQCGVFAKPEAAQQLAGELRSRGIEASSVPDNSSGPGRYYVRVGQFRTHGEAKRTLARVRVVQADAFIVP